MPIYEYGCAACGHEFEEWQKITDPPIKKCPACGKRKVQKLVSMSSFHLKGGGWYADLYSSAGSGSNGKSGGSTKSTDSSSATKPSATKNSSSSGASPSSSSTSSSSTSSSSKS